MANPKNLISVRRCKHPPEQLTAPASVVVLFAPGLERPYPLIPGEKYGVCGACTAIFEFVDKAQAAHAETKEAGQWTRAIVVFDDGNGVDIKNIRTSGRRSWRRRNALIASLWRGRLDTLPVGRYIAKSARPAINGVDLR